MKTADLKTIQNFCKTIGDDELKNSFPSEFLDDPKKIEGPAIENFKHTGIYLWSKGYKVSKCLGRGGFGTIWQWANGNAVLKVGCMGKGAIDEERASAKAIQSIFEENKKVFKFNSKCARKYFWSRIS